MSSLKEHFENYISECLYAKRLRPETIKGSSYAFKRFMQLVPEVSLASDVTPDIVAVFFKRLHTQERIVGKGSKVIGVSNTTVSGYAGRLKTFFKWMLIRKHIASNPFDFLKFPTPQFGDKRALTGDQIKKIMGGIAQNSPNSFLLKRDMAMVGILTFCGLRKTELISLEVRDIDLNEGFITVRSETSKSKRTRRIPMNAHLKLHLSEYFKERKKRNCKTQYLFVSNTQDRNLTPHGLNHWVKRLCKSSGVKFHLHRFRHTFATNLAMQDVGIIKIQKLMGHSEIKMTQTYLRSVATEDLKDDVNKLSFENLA